MILVDHNEPEQSIPGIEDLPVIEVVDHHRIGMMRTQTPIKFTGDIVGTDPVESRETPPNCSVSLTSQRHP